MNAFEVSLGGACISMNTHLDNSIAHCQHMSYSLCTLYYGLLTVAL